MSLSGQWCMRHRIFLVLEPPVLQQITPRTQWRQYTLLMGKRRRWFCPPLSTPLSQDHLFEVCIPPCIQIRFTKEQDDHYLHGVPWIARMQLFTSAAQLWLLPGFDKCAWNLYSSSNGDHSLDAHTFHGPGVGLAEGRQGALQFLVEWASINNHSQTFASVSVRSTSL